MSGGANHSFIGAPLQEPGDCALLGRGGGGVPRHHSARVPPAGEHDVMCGGSVLRKGDGKADTPGVPGDPALDAGSTSCRRETPCNRLPVYSSEYEIVVVGCGRPDGPDGGGAPSLEVSVVHLFACLVGLGLRDANQDAGAVAAPRHVAPAERGGFTAPERSHEQERGDRVVNRTALLGMFGGFGAATDTARSARRVHDGLHVRRGEPIGLATPAPGGVVRDAGKDFLHAIAITARVRVAGAAMRIRDAVTGGADGGERAALVRQLRQVGDDGGGIGWQRDVAVALAPRGPALPRGAVLRERVLAARLLEVALDAFGLRCP